MKPLTSLLSSFLVATLVGFAVAWPSAHQWDQLMTYERLSLAIIFFGASGICSLFFLKFLVRVGAIADGVRALGFLLGANLCFSLVRQELTFLVYAALWALPGTFLGTAFGKIWLERAAKLVPTERKEQLCPP